jgi:DcmR-like sensory protein
MRTERHKSVELGIDDERVDVSDHIAYFWETDQQFAEAVKFLEVGLRSGDAAIIFGHSSASSKVLSVLQSDGFDAEELKVKGRLAVLGGRPSGDDMLSEIGGAFQKAIDNGAHLVRLLGNIGWGHPDWPSELDILEFEARVTEACKSFPCVVVCMYDVAQLSGRVIVHGAYETHPLTFCGNVLRENPHHLPIGTFLAQVRATEARKKIA